MLWGSYGIIEQRETAMIDRIRDAYYEYCLARAQAGLIDDALLSDTADGTSIEEHMIETLRAAGKLPSGFEDAEHAARRTA
jgi:hypothetical protein